jgi:hypothetical protein
MRRAASALGAATALWLAAASGAAAAPERDVAVWDGGPSFGGAWIAHREAGSRPLRVTVRTPEGGSAEAVLIRAGAGAGAGFTVSATVARELGLEPGTPVELALSVEGSSEPEPPAVDEHAVADATERRDSASVSPPTAEPKRVRPRGDAPESVAVSPVAETSARMPNVEAARRVTLPGQDPTDGAPRPQPRADGAATPEASDALAEARAPRARPDETSAPSASPRPLGRPGAAS